MRGPFDEEEAGTPKSRSAFALRQAESGTAVSEIIRKMGISEPTLYRWKKKYPFLGVAELRRLKQLEDENKQLKSLVADLSLDKQMLQTCCQQSCEARSQASFGDETAGQLRSQPTSSLLGSLPGSFDLSIVDNFSRECLAIRIGQRLSGDNVVGSHRSVGLWIRSGGRCR
jgi:putative transposase